MTRSKLADLMEEVFREEIMFLREQGQKEYAKSTDNAFANFERVAEQLNLDRKKVLFTYMFKHIDGIGAWIEGHQAQREDVTGRINDAIVYLFLLRGMIEEERTDETEIQWFPNDQTSSDSTPDGTITVEHEAPSGVNLSARDEEGVGLCPCCKARYDLEMLRGLDCYLESSDEYFCPKCFADKNKQIILHKSPPQSSGTPSVGSES